MTILVPELPWFRQFTARFSAEAEQSMDCPAFELADMLEQGCVSEPTLQFTVPAQSWKARELTLVRSEDRLEYLLLAEDDTPLLLAQARPLSRRFDIFPASDTELKHPAFQLSFSQDTLDWELTSTRTGSSWGRKQPKSVLMQVHQERLATGPGLAMAMNVELPCSRAGCECALRRGDASRIDPLCCGRVQLDTLKPRWSPRLQSLTLDFHGRCTKASAKNFQLVASELQDQKRAVQALPPGVLLQFGKTKPHLFSLDFKTPFGVVQAFAAALSTAFWV